MWKRNFNFGGNPYVLDLLYVAITIAFFEISIMYVRGCDHLMGGSDE